MSYTFSHVVNELLDEKVDKISTARGKTMGAKSEIYQGSWTALNTWIESKLAKQKGAGISGFGCFCWELKLKDGITQCRPIFIISDSFVKNYQIKRQRIFRAPETTAIEEINHSILAIKFSNALTKDMIFSGLRDLFKKIGEFIYRGYDIEIQFTFGTLISKEKRVKFEFNQSRLQEILPERVVPGTLGFGKAPAHLIDENEDMVHPEDIYDDNNLNGVITYRDSEHGYEEDFNAKNDNALSHTARRIATALPTSSNSSKNIKIPILPIGKKQLERIPSTTTTIPATMKQTTLLKNNATKEIDLNNAINQTSQTLLLPPKQVVEYKVPSAPFAVNQTGNIHQLLSSDQTIGSPSKSSQSLPQDDSHQSIHSSNNNNNANRYSEVEDEVPSELKELLDTMVNKSKTTSKNEFRKGLTAAVLEQAYNRCIESVEQSTRHDEEVTIEARKSYENWRNNLKEERMKALNNTMEVKNALDIQKSSTFKRVEDEKNAQRDAIAAFILPANAGQVRNINPEVDSDGNILSFRSAVAKKVQEQIAKKIEDKHLSHQEKLNYEREYLQRLSLEIDLHNAMKRSNDLEKQRSLLEAWERDGHIKNLRKLQPFGTKPVKDYIQRNLENDQSYSGTFLLDTYPATTTTTVETKEFGTNNYNNTANNTTSSIGAKLNMSIGYDPRKGKI